MLGLLLFLPVFGVCEEGVLDLLLLLLLLLLLFS